MRERSGDILTLARHFLQVHGRKAGMERATLSAAAEAALLAHDWPGNVRELRNATERAMILEESSVITVPSLPIAISQPEIVEPEAAVAAAFPNDGLSLEDNERTLLARALEKTNGNQTQAARLLRITRDTLRYKMKKFNLR